MATKELKLKRISIYSDHTIGVMTFGGLFWTTIERPYIDNKPNISSIPTGRYKMARFSDLHGRRSSKEITLPGYNNDAWEVVDVYKRSYILIHAANWARNVQGCIGLGMGVFSSRDGVSSSRIAIKEFYRATSDLKEMTISIS